MMNESRFRMIEAADPARYKRLAAQAGEEASRRLAFYKHLSEWKASTSTPSTGVPAPADAAAAEAK